MMGKVNSVVLGVVMGIGVALAPVAVRAESLTDALIAAYRNSNLLDQNRALLRAADEDVAIAVSGLRPVVDFVSRARYNRSDVRNQLTRRVTESEGTTLTVALTAELTLYDGGATRYGIDAAKEIVLATRQSLVGVEHSVLFNAVDAYMQTRLAEDIVTLRQSNVRVIDRELAAARDRFELGEITRTDVAIAEARLAGARANLAAAEGDLAVQREVYNFAVGNFPRGLSNPPRKPQTAKSMEEAKAIARRNHYAIRQLQHEAAALELNLLRASAAMKPRITAGAEYGRTDEGFNSRVLSLTMSQRVYQGGKLSADYRKVLARRDAVRAALHNTVAEVDQAVGEGWARVAVARAQIEASDRQISAARTAYDGVREEAKLGARTTLDVLNAEQELLDAQAGRLQAVTGEYTATYGLLAAMGLLTVDHLKLGIPTYDVTGYYNAVKAAPATSSQGKKLDKVLKAIGN